MFDEFGCFIINEEKGGLKFYNGPSFTNQYAKPQFSSASNMLLGVDFKQQTIPMKVGLYWFTIEEYQEFLDCIGPYQVNYITFDFDKKYGYLVKSGKISDSVKHILGTDEDGNKRYYTEIDLTWEVLGDACVRSNLSYEYEMTEIKNEQGFVLGYEWKIAYNKDDKGEIVKDDNGEPIVKGDMSDISLLDSPIVFEIPCKFISQAPTLKLEAQYDDDPALTLFDIKLQNIATSSSSTAPDYILNIMYDSETGLMYVQEGSNTTWHLLNYQTDNFNGDLILESSTINKFKVVGKLKQPETNTLNWKFTLKTTDLTWPDDSTTALNSAVKLYSRKNVI